MKTAYLSLGSNVGDRERMLGEALRLLESPGLQVARVSPVYETEPQDFENQPWFLNLVVEAQTGPLPHAVTGPRAEDQNANSGGSARLTKARGASTSTSCYTASR